MLTIKEFNEQFDNDYVRVLHKQHDNTFLQIKLEYLKELQSVVAFVQEVIELEAIIEYFASEALASDVDYVVLVNIYKMEEEHEMYAMKTLELHYRKVIPKDESIYTELYSRSMCSRIVTEKHIKKLKKDIQAFDFFYPSKQ